MDVSSRRRVGDRGSVAAGSVWESRMKSDTVRGGIKVFHGEENAADEGGNVDSGSGTRLKRTQTGKRKTWQSQSSEGLGSDKNKIQIARRGKPGSQSQKNGGEHCRELSTSSDGDGIKKSPIQARKEIRASADKIERSPIHGRKQRSEMPNETSDSINTANQSIKNAVGSANENVENSIPPGDGIGGEIPVEDGKSDPDENCKDFGVCQETVISSSSDDVGVVKCSPELSVQSDGDSGAVIDDEADEAGEEDEVDEEIEIQMEMEMEKKSFDVKEVSIPESKVVNVKEPDNRKVVKEPENKMVVNEPDKEVVVNEPEKKKVVSEPEAKKVVSSLRRFHQNNERPVPVPLTVKQPPPIRRRSTIYQNFSKANSIPVAVENRSFPQTQNKVQSLVDLIMWRDVSRSAFVFGIGTFIIVSSSYAKDINLSLISVMSYTALVYLAVIFLYRSLICRGVIEVEDTNYVLGEEEAIWVLKLILPYLNEFLSKLRALFSGDPGTTIKLAVLLFVLARCGSSITIWKMAKFGFFGVFTIPKICSSYSAQLTGYANFWIRRFRDAWDSCSHKKAVALGIFTLVWNLSSVVARIWAVFVLFVAFRYYQQHYLVRDEWVEDEAGSDQTWQEPLGVGVGVGGHRQGRAPKLVETNKVKKGF